jgi:DNA polymerase III subunit delta
MPELTVATLRTRLAAGDVSPLYVIKGEDEVEKDELVSAFACLVEEDLRAFNLDRLHGGEIDVGRLEACAATLPMLSPRRVVVLMAAERLLVPKREGPASDEAQARLEALVASPPPHAVIVFVCGADPDKRRTVVKRLLAAAQVVTCGGAVADPGQWVQTRAAREGVAFDAGAVRALVARAGPDVARLRAGFERVVLYAMGAPRITVEDVREAVPAGPEAQVHFGLANAIRAGDTAAALRQLGLALDGGAAPLMVLGQVRYAVEGLPAPRLPAAVDAVLRTDLAMKSSGADQRVLLERLVFEICDSGGRGGPAPVHRAGSPNRQAPRARTPRR